jgi:alcohol dehydrogenase class IV
MRTLLDGSDGLAGLARSVRDLGAGEVVAVIDGALLTSGYMTRVLDALDAGDVTVHALPPGEPTAASVDDAAGVVRHAGTPVVLGIGGGTALDTAKLAAAVAGDSLPTERYALEARRLPRGWPVVAIPTTAGTGSEVTRTSVFTTGDGRKVWAWGDELLPDVVVLDPVATATVPAPVTTATGLDACVHAVEALTGRRAGACDPAPGRQAVRLVFDHLPRAVGDGTDLDARAGMQRAAMLAGQAIDAGGTAAAHAIGHALGSLGHVPHGLAVAVGLAAAIDWNVDGAPGAHETVAAAIGCSVADVPAAYSELVSASALRAAVGRVGRLSVSVDTLAAAIGAAENRPMLANNCRPVDDRDRYVLAERTLAAWDGLVDP